MTSIRTISYAPGSLRSALPVLWLIPLFGGLLLVGAMAVAILSWWTASHHPAYRLSTAGQHDIDGRGNDRRMQVTVRTA
ncbi:MAG: hypothetical protein ACXW29_13740 [Thermoanaerobaculia bacterium]